MARPKGQDRYANFPISILAVEDIRAVALYALYYSVGRLAECKPMTIQEAVSYFYLPSDKITSWQEINPKSKLKELSLTFDNKNSSTVRFALDSICKGESLAGKNIYAQGTNEKVIDYVAATPGAIGVIGASWIGNENDSTNMSFSDRVKVVALSRDNVATAANSYQPYQAYIALDYYPFTRYIYAMDISSRTGLARGFSNFLATDKGQLIILKAGMMPTTQQVVIKKVKVTD